MMMIETVPMSTYHYSRRNIVVSHGCHFQLKIKKTQRIWRIETDIH